MYRVKHHLSGHVKTPQRLLVSQAGDLLVSSSNDLTIRPWSPTSGALLHAIADFDPGAHQAVLAWDLSPNGDYLATGMADLTTKV